ncbi:hypothetical protein [Streptacidiphilus anmyonensis]|uniref:hypothetical protein n=1 Tax=Streptacidiphilus anmyonensis TaxID=405782 RepID=UPI0005AAFD35|nr:hypothetical protein [Streptacidiphilus anmyonensis]
MGSTFTQAKEKTATAAHTVTDGAAAVREHAARLARRAADQTGTARGTVGTLTARAGRAMPDRAALSAGHDVSGRTKALIGLGAAVALAGLAWLGLRGRVD